MNFNKKRLKDVAILSVVVLLLQVVLSRWIYPLFKTTTQQLFAISPVTAIGSQTFGNKIIGFLMGILPFELGKFQTWIAVYVGVFLCLLVGYWIYDQKWAWKGKGEYQRIWAILMYGTLVLYVFLLLTKIAAVQQIALPLLIGLALNYVIIALIVSCLAKRFPAMRV